MDRNVGGYDRNARFVLGAILLLVGIVSYAGVVRVAVGPVPQALGTLVLVFVLAGVGLLVTGYTQKCPINSVLGINTCNPHSR